MKPTLLQEISDAIVYPSISAEPHQPACFKFPKGEFGKKFVVKRSFQVEWFSKWPWVHCREDDDTVFCHTCVKAFMDYGLKGWIKTYGTYGLKLTQNGPECSLR